MEALKEMDPVQKFVVVVYDSLSSKYHVNKDLRLIDGIICNIDFLLKFLDDLEKIMQFLPIDYHIDVLIDEEEHLLLESIELYWFEGIDSDSICPYIDEHFYQIDEERLYAMIWFHNIGQAK